MSVETNAPLTRLDYRQMAIDVAAFAAIAYATVLVHKVEHDPILLAQMPSFLAGRIADGTTATCAMPFARAGAVLLTALTRLGRKHLSRQGEDIINDERIHAAGVFGMLSLGELVQGPLAYPSEELSPSGTFDWGDIAAFGVGTLGWLALDRTTNAVGDIRHNSTFRRLLRMREDKQATLPTNITHNTTP